MRIAVIDAFGGLAGDMFVGALLDLGVDPKALGDALASLGLPGWELHHTSVKRRQLGATKADFEVQDQSDHRHLPEILGYIESSALSSRAKAMATRTFELLAEAEAKAHKIPLERVHFHEVGAMDAILDVCAVCVGLDALDVQRVYAGPLPAGSGTVNCAHGEMPVPVPAVVNLLDRFELRLGEGEGEMITPTGAALLAAWGEPQPKSLGLRPTASGYGAGTRERSIMRVTLGEGGPRDAGHAGYERDEVWVLETHLDDCTGESIGFLFEALMGAGALDVAAAPVLMKKGRPGHALTVMVADGDMKSAVVDALFMHSSTLGLRERRSARMVLPRKICRVSTDFGEVRMKVAKGRGAQPEYEDCAKLAREAEVSLAQVFEAALAAFHATMRVKGGGEGDAS